MVRGQIRYEPKLQNIGKILMLAAGKRLGVCPVNSVRIGCLRRIGYKIPILGFDDPS